LTRYVFFSPRLDALWVCHEIQEKKIKLALAWMVLLLFSVCGSLQGFLLYAVNIDMFFYKPGISLFLGTRSIYGKK